MIHNKTVFVVLLSCLSIPVLSKAEENPGINFLINSSSDIIIAKTISLNPRLALGGMRDTAKIKVVRSLKGSLKTGDTIGIYYHLYKVGPTTFDIEKNKLAGGKELIIFLKSETHIDADGGNKKIKYKFTDRWLSVHENYPDKYAPNLEKVVMSRLKELKKPAVPIGLGGGGKRD